MSHDDGQDLTTEDLMVPPPRWMHPLQRFIKSVVEEFLPVWEKLRDAMEQIGEQLETINEREKTRAYQELVTPPHDHTRTHVTHTRSKPPHPARIYRRRTP